MIPIRREDKVKFLTAGITLAASNTRRFLLANDTKKVLREIEACRGFLTELEHMAQSAPDAGNTLN